jgi:ubiquinone/menaquinone biosynthesis C-methylase UbiE
MLELLDISKIKAAETYNNAAEYFDDRPLAFWETYGRRTVERLPLSPRATVLDVGCGSGASALPAAEVVGPGGYVVAVDLAGRLLELGRRKAAQRHLHNLRFIPGDMTNLGFASEQFDAVISGFSLFFVPDMEAQVRELWRMVRPGGKLAITTWGPRLFEPTYSMWREAVKKERPDLYARFQPWDHIDTPAALARLLLNGGVMQGVVVTEKGSQALRSPEDWWTIVLGSGLRGTIDEMHAESVARVRRATLQWVHNNAVTAVETNVLYAIAVKSVTCEWGAGCLENLPLIYRKYIS